MCAPKIEWRVGWTAADLWPRCIHSSRSHSRLLSAAPATKRFSGTLKNALRLRTCYLLSGQKLPSRRYLLISRITAASFIAPGFSACAGKIRKPSHLTQVFNLFYIYIFFNLCSRSRDLMILKKDKNSSKNPVYSFAIALELNFPL